MNYKEICTKVCGIVRETAGFIDNEALLRSGLHIEEKGEQDFVTRIDKGAEERLVNGLSELLPEAGFFAEEGTSEKKGDRYNWIIDPIDGTTNFIHGLPPYAISVALMEENEIVIGVVFELGFRDMFYAWKGSKSYMNGIEINVTKTPTVKQSLIATGFPYTDFSRMKGFFETMDYFMKHSHGLRRLGSAATDIVYIACGRFDAFYEYGLHAWDVAAGALILKQAGGRVCDFNGGENYLFSGEIIASNAEIFDEFKLLIRKFMV